MLDINFETAESRFTGGLFADFFIRLLSRFVSTISLGLLWPFMFCWHEKWEAEHTYINGRQLTFDGNGLQFWGRFFLWWFLSVITLGIYYIFFMSVALAKWETKHTHFADVVKNGELSDEENKSYFDGKALQLVGVKLLNFLIMVESLGLAYFWTQCIHQRWYGSHQVIDGERIYFDGNGLQLLGKVILWDFLTIITLGIFIFWLNITLKKWVIYHTHISPDTTEKSVLQTPLNILASFIGSIACLIGLIIFISYGALSNNFDTLMKLASLISLGGGVGFTFYGIKEMFAQRKTQPVSSLYSVATVAMGVLLIEITIVFCACGLGIFGLISF